MQFKPFIVLLIILQIACLQNVISQSNSSNIPATSIKKITITGRVSSGDEPVIGATVMVKNTFVGVAADLDGNFTLSANPGDFLIVSAIGYETKELRIDDGKLFFEIELEGNSVDLLELAVVGYGTQERRDLTGSVAKVDMSTMEGVATSFDNALAGKVAGVQVSSSSGAPGSATSISIRGISSLNGSTTNPLIVVDGVPIYGTGRESNTVDYSGGTVAGATIGGGGAVDNYTQEDEFEKNPLASLNPDDIESIEILKDAYSTAIYGSRGANGVILITTKRGRQGSPGVNVKLSTSVNLPVGTHKVMSASQYADFYQQYYKDAVGRTPTFDQINDVNWVDEVIRPGLTHEGSVNISNGTDFSDYYISLGGLTQDFYVIGQDYDRYTLRTNFRLRPADKLEVGLNQTTSYTHNASINSQSIYREAVLHAPNVPIQDEEGNYVYDATLYNDKSLGNSNSNPVADAEKNIQYSDNTRTIANVFAEYKPFDWLTYKTEVGVDIYNTRTYTRIKSTPTVTGGTASETQQDNLKLLFNNYLSLNKTVGKHALNAILGTSFETSTENTLAVIGSDFYSDELLSISSAETQSVTAAYSQQWALLSYFSRMNYRYNGKYLLGLTYRIDGSSRFNVNNRYVGFPSVSAGWVFSKESFLDDVYWLDFSKVRASFGSSGIDGSGGYYGTLSQYQTISPNGLPISYAGTRVIELQQPSSPNLEWETTYSFDAGLDAEAFANRIMLTLDYYYKKTTNSLYSSWTGLYTGYSTQQQNIGDILNTGVELTLTTENINNKNFNWSTSFNIAHNANKVLKLNYQGDDSGNSSDAYYGYSYIKEGESLGLFYLYDWAGVDQETGDPLWRYSDGTLSTTPPASLSSNSLGNRYAAGSSLPVVSGGITNTFQYGQWDLNIFCSFSIGNKMYNGSKATLQTYVGDSYNNLSPDMMQFWHAGYVGTGVTTEIPSLINASTLGAQGSASESYTDYTSGRTIDRYLEDGSYLRMKTLTLSYRFEDEVLNRINLKSLSVYFQGDNLLTLTGYTGVDPEVNAYGSSALYAGRDELTLPQARTFKIGLRTKF